MKILVGNKTDLRATKGITVTDEEAMVVKSCNFLSLEMGSGK